MADICRISLAAALAATVFLAGCENGEGPAFLRGSTDSATDNAPATRSVEREVEAPEVFHAADKGLWDGRPSLGGVWVAHPDVQDPERVIIRNASNSKFVIGVLYRPERQTAGPAFQVSSDAAAALGMQAGTPAQLTVTALRRQQVEEALPTAPEAEKPGTLAAAPAVAETSLDPIAVATAALDAAESRPGATPASAPSASALTKPYLQIGIFSVKRNADNAAAALRKGGMTPTIKPGKMNGKAFWRVIVGPASTSKERGSLLSRVKSLGFTDAYAVTN